MHSHALNLQCRFIVVIFESSRGSVFLVPHASPCTPSPLLHHSLPEARRRLRQPRQRRRRRRAAAGGTQNGRAHSHGASAPEKGSKVGAVNGCSISLAEKKVRGNGSGGISSHGWACSVRSVCAQRETARAAERHGRRRASGGTGVPIRTVRAHEGRGTR